MIGNRERAYRSRHLRRALLGLRECVCSGKIQGPERRRSQFNLSTARNAAVRVEIPAKPAEGIGRKIDQAGEVEDDYPAPLGVKIRCRRAHPVVGKCLINSDVECDRLFRLQTWFAKDRVAKQTIEGGAEAFKQRRRSIAVADVPAQLCARRSKRVSDRAVASVCRWGRLKSDSRVRRGGRGRKHRLLQSKQLRAESRSDLQTVVEKAQLVLNEEGVALLRNVDIRVVNRIDLKRRVRKT